MIGQESLQDQLKNIFDSNFSHRFIIISGEQGSGRRLISRKIAQLLGADITIIEDLGVNSIRELIDTANSHIEPMVYVLSDADEMSIIARNTLLKTIEEPPNNAYFILTVESEYNLLNTIRSRGFVLNMDAYSDRQLLSYAEKYNTLIDTNLLNSIVDICNTPGQIDEFVSSGPKEFYEYVKLVADNIADVSGANAFKIANKLALKDSDKGYNFKLFLKAFMQYCEILHNDGKLTDLKYSAALNITLNSLQHLRIKGVNKLFLADKWILDIRKAWMGE